MGIQGEGYYFGQVLGRTEGGYTPLSFDGHDRDFIIRRGKRAWIVYPWKGLIGFRKELEIQHNSNK